MGMKDYQVRLIASSVSSLKQRHGVEEVSKMALGLQCKWKQIKICSSTYTNKLQMPLAYVTSEEAVEMLIDFHDINISPVVSLRFDYCNPRKVYTVFFDIIEWLMQEYLMKCQPMREMGKDKEGQILHAQEITEISLVRSLLTPSMDYKRDKWLEWAGVEITDRRLHQLLARLQQECSG